MCRHHLSVGPIGNLGVWDTGHYVHNLFEMARRLAAIFLVLEFEVFEYVSVLFTLGFIFEH